MMDSDIDLKLFDLLLTDVASEDLHSGVSTALGSEYLIVATEEQSRAREVVGIIWGLHNRLFVPLVVRRRDSYKKVHFLVDTGAPRTYLSKEVLTSFGISTDNITSSTTIAITINAINIAVTMSPTDGHFSDINLLGVDFLDVSKSLLVADYFEKKCRLTIRPDF